jgi:hypothetical protein
VLLAAPVSVYYIMYVNWALYYFWMSLRGVAGSVPWASCPPLVSYNCCVVTDSECFNQTNAIAAPEAFFQLIITSGHSLLSAFNC